MADQPFADPAVPDLTPSTAPTGVPAPKGIGVRKLLLAAGVLLGTVAAVGFLLLGARTMHRGTQRPASSVAEAAPQPPTAGDPLRGLSGDYQRLLAKPPAAPPPVGPLSPPPAQTVPAAPEPAAHQTPAKAAQKDRGVLVVEGKHQRDPSPGPVTARYEPTAAPESGVAGGQPAEQAPATTVERQQAFLGRQTALRRTQLDDRLHTPESRWMLLAGDIIPATLVTGIQSDLPGELLARVRLPVRESVTGSTVLLPQGTMLLGTYNNDLVYGQDRVLVVWHRLRLPNGQTIQLQGMPGMDLSGYAGLKDRVDNHLWPLFRAVILSSVLSVGSRLPAGSTPQNYQQTLAQEFAQDFGSAANRAGQQIVQRELQRPPTVTIRPGMSFNVFVLTDMVLQPYTGAVTYAQ